MSKPVFVRTHEMHALPVEIVRIYENTAPRIGQTVLLTRGPGDDVDRYIRSRVDETITRSDVFASKLRVGIHVTTLDLGTAGVYEAFIPADAVLSLAQRMTKQARAGHYVTPIDDQTVEE